jgi:hypothetical protein
MINPIVESVGVEWEFTGPPRYKVANKFSSMLNVVSDGSVRNYRVVDGRRTECGGEIVTPVINTNEKAGLEPLMQAMQYVHQMGQEIDLRAGVHIHVNISNLPLYILQNIIKLSLATEDQFFRLGEAELNFHRGEVVYDYGYCRPLSSPPITRTSGGCLRPVFTPQTLLAAKNLQELHQAWGRADRFSGKYLESRYVALNLVPYWKQGSAEFRVFNPTLKPRNIKTWVNLCKALCKRALQLPPDFSTDQQPLGSGGSLEDLVQLLQVSPALKHDLKRLWYNSTPPQAPKGRQLGHLPDYQHVINWNGVRKELVPPQVDETNLFTFEEFYEEVNVDTSYDQTFALEV